MKGNKAFLAQISQKFIGSVINSATHEGKGDGASELKQNVLYLIKLWGSQYTFVNGAPSEFFKAFDKLQKARVRFPESLVSPEALLTKHHTDPRSPNPRKQVSPTSPGPSKTKTRPVLGSSSSKKHSVAPTRRVPVPITKLGIETRSPRGEQRAERGHGSGELKTTPHRDVPSMFLSDAEKTKRPALSTARELLSRLKRSMDLWSHEKSAFAEMEQNVKRLITRVGDERLAGHREPELLALGDALKEIPTLMMRGVKDDMKAKLRLLDICTAAENGELVRLGPVPPPSARHVHKAEAKTRQEPAPRTKASMKDSKKISPKRIGKGESPPEEPSSHSPPKMLPAQESVPAFEFPRPQDNTQTSNSEWFTNTPAIHSTVPTGNLWGEMPSFGTKCNSPQVLIPR